ncbi:hypothetical protein BME99_19995 [Pseudomonas protegens]|nr:hypothetical protein BME99_19995 [Pseudomonas protegens]
MVDLDLALVLVEAVDLVAVAVGDLELADLVALGLELFLKGLLILPLRAFGGGALRAGEGQGAGENQGQQEDLAHGKRSGDGGDSTVQNQA